MVAFGQSPQGFLNHVSRQIPGGWSHLSLVFYTAPEDAKVPCDWKSQASMRHLGPIFAAEGRHDCLWAEPTRYSESHFPLKAGRMITLKFMMFLPHFRTSDASLLCC